MARRQFTGNDVLKRRPFAKSVDDSNADDKSRMSMQRGVSQLLFNYLPGRTVDWEDGLAIVQLGSVQLSSAWPEERKEVVLNEISELFERWTSRGGSIDKLFPDPKHEAGRFTIGLPEAIEAQVLQTALVCHACGRLFFKRLSGAAKGNGAIACPGCGSGRVRQVPWVFVHGCGSLQSIDEWLPATKSDLSGSTRFPIRCPTCKETGQLLHMPNRSERVKDMRVVCRNCNTEVLERFTARCEKCLNEINRQAATVEGDERVRGETVSRIAMRVSRYSASDTYYPQSMSILRLDRPRLTTAQDDIATLLYRLLPAARRPDASVGTADNIAAVAERLRAAERAGDEAEGQRLRKLLADLATGAVSRQLEADEGLLPSLTTDLEKSIKESLAFRETVTTRPAIAEAQRQGGISTLLSDQVMSRSERLSLHELLFVEDLPVITATYGYTRRSFEPTYEELGAKKIATRIRAFHSLQDDAARRLSRPDLSGTIPILAREGEHEGLFLSLQPERVVQWLGRNGINLPNEELPAIARILRLLEPVDRYYDNIWNLEVRRLVFGLIHSLSHAAMRALTRYAGIERTSVAEYMFLPLLGSVVYDNSSTFRLGGIATLVRDHLGAFLDCLTHEAIECLYDTECIDHCGACHGCIHSPEISCRVFNHGLSRSFLIGGHKPWADITTDEQLTGYWSMDA